MSDWVTIARLIRARGNRGELSGLSLTRRSVAELASLGQVALFRDNAPEEWREIESLWEQEARGAVWLIFKFKGIDAISDAERLAGAEVRIPARDRPALPDDEFYHSDLAGCEVCDRATGRPFGRVSGLEEYGGPLLLKVDTPAGELLIPFARSICAKIDVKARRIEVDLPEGLAELNR